jgi:hypothetical protein
MSKSSESGMDRQQGQPAKTQHDDLWRVGGAERMRARGTAGKLDLRRRGRQNGAIHTRMQ